MAGDERIAVPPGVDITTPSVARGYDYALGGRHNYEVDRVAADALTQAFPGAIPLARDNRAMLRRGVRFLVGEVGIRQIVDVGSGLPSAGNVHEVAHAIDPSVRVVYADHDPIVLAYGRALLADNNTTTVIRANAAEPASILDHPETRALIDFTQPFAVILSGILHHLHDEQDPAGVAAAFRDRLPSGGYMLISNFLDDGDPRAKAAEQALTGGFGTGRFRTWDEQLPFFAGLELVEPGLVYANDWRPDAQTARDSEWHRFYCAGVGRKP